jgi:hypothetical protein
MGTPIKLLIAIHGNYSYLPRWTYPLKIYRKRFQFASKSIIYNAALSLFYEGHLKGQQQQQQQELPPPPDASSRLPQEQSFRQPLELVGHGREALQHQQLPPREKVCLHLPAEGSFPS